ncbi:sigma-70 family RNA polymerase sigma factor [bacterium]|nr:sigma-70 family RNA polymerase sigma factor [bacterium]
MANDPTVNLENLTDETLFNRYKMSGDMNAFNTILRRYQSPLFSFLVSRTKNKSEADDIFQEVFIKVVDKRHLFTTDVSFKAWLYTIARNTFIDAYRKKTRHKGLVPLDEKPDDGRALSESLGDNDFGLDEKVSGSNLDEILTHILQELPEEQRETFVLRVKSEMTFEEIGEAMDCSVNTVKSRMRYALEELRKIFNKRGILK